MSNLVMLCLFVLICSFSHSIVCDELTINYSPSSLRFGSANSLYVSDFGDVLASALGYTPQKSPSWSGLTVTSPFDYPSSIICFVVRDAGISVRMEGATYDLKEDVPILQSYETFTSLVGARALREVHFSYVNAIDLVPQFDEVGLLPKTKKLEDTMVEPFLQQMGALASIVNYLDIWSTKGVGGQDITFIEVNSFAPLVKKFGANSSQVNEAAVILRSSLSEAIDHLREFYSDRVVVATVKLAPAMPLVRVERQIQISDSNDKAPGSLNLASIYNDDFPVIFNIVLFLSIILVVAILATSASMAFMDPGRDSIIYRMTNPRMKKDQ